MWNKSISFPKIEVSRDGRLRTWHGGWNRYVEKKTRLDKDGYKVVATRHEDGRTTTARVHRLVAEAYISNKEDKPVINHKNGIKNDNRVENLQWNTISENTIHGLEELGNQPSNSQKILLIINNKPFSTYHSMTNVGEKIGINRNDIGGFSDMSEGYFVFKRVDRDFEFTNHNEEIWKKDFKLNPRGRFYKIEDNYYDKVKDIIDIYNCSRDIVYRGIKKGFIKDKKIESVSCKEFLINSRNRNW